MAESEERRERSGQEQFDDHFYTALSEFVAKIHAIGVILPEFREKTGRVENYLIKIQKDWYRLPTPPPSKERT